MDTNKKQFGYLDTTLIILLFSCTGRKDVAQTWQKYPWVCARTGPADQVDKVHCTWANPGWKFLSTQQGVCGGFVNLKLGQFFRSVYKVKICVHVFTGDQDSCVYDMSWPTFWNHRNTTYVKSGLICLYFIQPQTKSTLEHEITMDEN